MAEITFRSALCTETILAEIACKQLKRDDIALCYALAIIVSYENDWGKINNAIRERWSISGLEYIKEKAWKIIEDKQNKLEG